MRLTDDQQQTIINALTQTAADCRGEANALSRSMGDAALPSVIAVIARLHQSADEYAGLREVIEAAEHVEVLA